MNKDKVWDSCLDLIKRNIDNKSFDTWFKPISPLELNDNTLVIEVPNKFFYEYLETNYIDVIKTAIKNELGSNSKLKYKIKTLKPTPTKKIKISPNGNDIMNPIVFPGLKKTEIDSQLNDNYRFENFILGDSNRLARSAGYTISQKPGNNSFNPFLIFGGVGLGKTHLVHAIGLEIKKKFPDKKVLYISAEKFMLQFTDAAIKNNTNDFIHFYENMVDVLIIDDIQFFSNKRGTQDVFFKIFNHLHHNQKQIIMTSDKPAMNMEKIQYRLLSRFNWGLTADIKNPDIKTRINILENKIKNDNINISDDIILEIAKHIETNIRDLEGCLHSILAESLFNKKEITMQLVRQILSRFISNKKKLEIKDIEKIVCNYFDLSTNDIHKNTRIRSIVQARQLSMYFSKKYTKYSLEKIGNNIGKKNHATVIYACKVIKNLMDTNKSFKKSVIEIDKLIKHQ